MLVESATRGARPGVEDGCAAVDTNRDAARVGRKQTCGVPR
jgi:hypothetical protein